MLAAAENLRPAGARLREDFLIRLATLMELAPTGQPQRDGIPRELTVALGLGRVPTFLLDRLPPGIDRSFYDYELRANDTRPPSLKPTSLSFVGSLTIGRILRISGPTDAEVHWSVQYDINSLRRQIGRTVVGTEVHSLNTHLNQPLPLPDTPLEPFPSKLAVTEAEQLMVLFDHCEEHQRRVLSLGGSSEN